MFGDSLLQTSWAERGRRSCTTLTSFGLQAVIVGLLLLIPLWTTVGLPNSRTVSTPITVGRRNPGPTPRPQGGGGARNMGVQIIPYSGPFMQPSHIGHGVQPEGSIANSDPIGPPVIGPGGYGGADTHLPMEIGGTNTVLPPAPKVEKIFRKSEILQGMLIRKVEPKYPPLAIQARVQGSVVLAAVISKAGTIDNLHLVSGHPMLVAAAIDAVSQWRYRPYILNGDVIEVETQITVNFTMDGR